MRRNGPALLRPPSDGEEGVEVRTGARYGGAYEPLMTRLMENRPD
jgi:hypothetical protein